LLYRNSSFTTSFFAYTLKLFIITLNKKMSTLDLRKKMDERKRYMYQPLNNGLKISTNRYFNHDQESLREKIIPGL